VSRKSVLFAAMSDTSPTFRLADMMLDGKLRQFVEERRSVGLSWRRIALDLRDETDRGIDVAHETLRGWFPEDRDQDPAA
jgi:hypothetical protein